MNKKRRDNQMHQADMPQSRPISNASAVFLFSGYNCGFCLLALVTGTVYASHNEEHLSEVLNSKKPWRHSQKRGGFRNLHFR